MGCFPVFPQIIQSFPCLQSNPQQVTQRLGPSSRPGRVADRCATVGRLASRFSSICYTPAFASSFSNSRCVTPSRCACVQRHLAAAAELRNGGLQLLLQSIDTFILLGAHPATHEALVRCGVEPAAHLLGLIQGMLKLFPAKRRSAILLPAFATTPASQHIHADRSCGRPFEKNHTKAFWALVARHMPDWQRQHAMLEKAVFGDAV